MRPPCGDETASVETVGVIAFGLENDDPAGIPVLPYAEDEFRIYPILLSSLAAALRADDDAVPPSHR